MITQVFTETQSGPEKEMFVCLIQRRPTASSRSPHDVTWRRKTSTENNNNLNNKITPPAVKNLI